MPPLPAWALLTLCAVCLQTVRTAAQKRLGADIDAVTATLARFLFGLPFAALYLWLVLRAGDYDFPRPGAVFFIFASVAALAQIAATVMLIELFSHRNFAVGTSYARSEALLTALLGALFYGETVSALAWLSIVISAAGVMLLSAAGGRRRPNLYALLTHRRGAALGLGAGFCFAIASLSLRRASLSFGIDAPLLTAGVSLLYMIALQTALMLGYALLAAPETLRALFGRWRLALFIGVTSALGSIAWFIAITLERASYVKALGQIEFVFALLISKRLFDERSTPAELAAMLLIGGGLLLLLTAG